MRIQGEQSVGFGSGTIIHSTLEESIILTAAHYFKLGPQDKSGLLQKMLHEGPTQVPPAKFPFKIHIDLFDGILTGSKPAQVSFVEAVAGEVVDYDFDRDVALVRIRPGRQLPASRLVSKTWIPQVGMQVLTVGCSEGRNPTAWHTVITKPPSRAILQQRKEYEAIECRIAPKQGRSGGGLFTTDGYLGGVCNYAEPQENHGFYASPTSIYGLLDRNGLAFVYEDSGIARHDFDDQVRVLDAQIDEQALKLSRLKELRRQAGVRSQIPRPVPPSTERAEPPVAPLAEPTLPPSESPDHERRLRNLEQKLDRVLKLLDDHKFKSEVGGAS